jgi:rifampicin phosphotransferase
MWLLPLDEAATRDVDTLGGKAARLVWLHARGFPVPESWVLPSTVFRTCTRSLPPGLEPRSLLRASSTRTLFERCEKAQAATMRITFPSDLERELRALYRRLESTCPWGLAVRSSATSEDGARISMAGLADSVIGVQSEAALLDAVRTVWASIVSGRAMTYLARSGVRDVAMAVVIQRVVPATTSGVLFTRSPVPPYVEGCTINACHGLSGPLVGGEITPDVFQFDAQGVETKRTIAHKDKRLVLGERGTLHAQANPTPDVPALTDEALTELRALATSLVTITQEPWDLEFVVEGTKVWLVQGRPITAAGYPEGGDASTVWSNANVGEALTGPMSPLTWSVATEFSERGFRHAFRALGCTVPKRTRLVASVHGRPYLNLTRFFDIASQVPWVDARIVAELGGSSPELAKLLSAEPQSHRMFYARAPWTITRLVQQEAQLAQRISTFVEVAKQVRASHRAMDLAILPDEGLARVFAKLRRFLDHTGTLMLTAASSSLGAHLLLRKVLAKFAPEKADLYAQALTRGVGDLESHRPAHDLHRLGTLARTDSVGRDALLAKTPWETFPDCPTKRALVEFLETHGERGFREAELGAKRWREDPSALLLALGSNLAGSGEARARDALASEDVLRTFGTATRLVVKPIAKRALLATQRREVMRAWVTRVLGMLRDVALEANKRVLELMPETAKLSAGPDRVEPVFLFTEEELLLTLKNARTDLIPILRERHAQYVRDLQTAEPPLTFVGAPPGTVDTFAKGARTLQGFGAGSGVGTGVVRVLASPSARFEPGEILVARATDIGWTPLFPLAAGIVTELGGTLSHAAIVAREYGVPTVVGVAHATKALVTGMRVRVHGSSGNVEILSDP